MLGLGRWRPFLGTLGNHPMYVTGILLAAGSASRMGTDKLSLLYKGNRIIDRSLEPLLASPLISEVIIVVSPGFRLRVGRPRCTVVVNHDCQEGMASSLRTGVRAASADAEAYLVALADMPEITADILTTLIEAFARSERQILVPVYKRRPGHPVILHRECRDRLLRLRGDVGARMIIRRHPEIVEYFSTDHPAVVFDVNTPEDLSPRRILFTATDEFLRAQAALEKENIYFSTVPSPGDADLACAAAVRYYAFDEERVLALCKPP